MIAVHCGAGQYSANNLKEYKLLNKKACRKGMKILNDGGTALEAVREAITVLENDSITNAGFGSNLTLNGSVECDASLMDEENHIFGACGAVRRVKNPICLAYDICQKQLESWPLGLVPPNLIVGSGAYKHAKASGLKIVKEAKLKSKKALNHHVKYKALLDAAIEAQKNQETCTNIDLNQHTDTVGAVCIDDRGHVAAGCSSGGILLKRSGRIGQAAHYGSGVWAESYDPHTNIAVCTTGCGEQLMQTFLAKTIADDLAVGKSCPTVDLHLCMKEKFMDSRYLRGSKVAKLGGALVLKADISSGDISLLWGHSTSCLGVGYMKKGDAKAFSQISLLPNDAQEGQSINIGGTEFHYQVCPIIISPL